MIMQQQTNEELCNLLIQSIDAKDEKSTLKVLEQEDEAIIRDIVNRVPVHHVRKLVIELRNILSNKITVNHLKWLQQIIVLKFSVISSMADGRSVLLPLISLLDDRSSPAYYAKMQALRGKINLLQQLKEARRLEVNETIVRVPSDRDQSYHMAMDVESDTESGEEFDIDDEDEDEDEEEEFNEDVTEKRGNDSEDDENNELAYNENGLDDDVSVNHSDEDL